MSRKIKYASMLPHRLPDNCTDLGDSPRLSDVSGFRTASTHSGLKTASGSPHDMALIVSENGANAAAVFTKNLIRAAPVEVSKTHIRRSPIRAVITNAGNANCCTGTQGLTDAEAMCVQVADGLSCKPEQVLVASTGIIGHQLPMDKIHAGIGALLSATRRRKRTGDFAKAILTTDLVAKRAGVTVSLPSGKTFKVIGCAKGSGMIAPNLGTMLAYIVTDLNMPPSDLKRALKTACNATFNRITVDGDTSTNDSVFLLSDTDGVSANDEARSAFLSALMYVAGALAYRIAADGEGATRTAVVFVGGARTESDAHKAAYAIAHSPLVKTALAGGDPNWGRIAAAAGRSGARFDPNEMSITIGDVDVFRNGEPVDFNPKRAAAAMRAKNVAVVVMLGDGPYAAHFTTCDLTHGYVTINADYHT